MDFSRVSRGILPTLIVGQNTVAHHVVDCGFFTAEDFASLVDTYKTVVRLIGFLAKSLLHESLKTLDFAGKTANKFRQRFK